MMVKPKRRKYWYATLIWFCPVCGAETMGRERKYVDVDGPKPCNPYTLIEVYDYCDSL